MRKFYTLAAAALFGISAFADPVTVPYSAESSGYDNWDIKNLNKDAKTWELYSGSEVQFAGCTKGLKYYYNKNSAADDWAISPGLSLEAGKEYKIKFAYKTGGYDEKLSIWISTENTPEQLAQGTNLLDFSGQEKNGKKEAKLFTPTVDGVYYLGAYAHSDKDKLSIYFTGVEVAENVFTPAAVKNLTLTPGANHALEATLNWTLPTTDSDDVPFADGVAVESVTVYRDGVLAATLGGDAISWTDNAESGLTPGKHKYEVEVTVNGSKSIKAAVQSPYLGPVPALQLPLVYNMADCTQEDYDLFFASVAGDASTIPANYKWQFKASSYTGNRVVLSTNSSYKEDDWLILPSVKVEKPGIYRFGLDLEKNSDKGKLDIRYATDAAYSESGIAALTGEIGTYEKEKISTHAYRYYTFNFPAAGEYKLALHACAPTSDYNYYSVYGFSLEEWHDAALNVTDLTAQVEGDNIKVSWTNPSKTSQGNDIEALVKVEIFRDGESAATITDGLTPGAEASWIDENPANGCHLYKVVAYNGEFAPDADAPEVRSDWKGDRLQALPFDYTFGTAEPATYALFTGEKMNDEDPDWVIDANGAVLPLNGKTNYYQPNSRLLTPPFELTPGYYDLSIRMQAPCNKFRLKLGYVMEAEPSVLKGKFEQTLTSTYLSEYKLRIHVTDEGRAMFAAVVDDYLAQTGNKDFKITAVKIERTLIVPDIATDVTVTPAADLSKQATISWTNPTSSNVDGVEPELEKAIVYREGTPIATITEGLVCGGTSSYLDTEVPNAGCYVYKVEIYSPEGCSATEATEVTSPWIGGGKDLPFEASSKEDWTILNLNNDKNSWGDPITWNATSNGDLSIISNKNVPDDWAITPRLNLIKDCLYTISCYPTKGYGSTATADMRVQLYWGSSDNPSDMTVKLADIGPFNATADKELFTVKVLAVDPDAVEAQSDEIDLTDAVKVPAGVGLLGIHCAKKTDEIYIREFKMDGGIPTGIDKIFADGSGLFGADARDIIVCDAAGRMLLRAESAADIDWNRLAKGVYIVSGYVDGNRLSIKIAL